LYNNVGIGLVNMHRYDEAILQLNRLLDLARANGPELRSMRNALTVIANARRYQGDLDGALKTIREARSMSPQIAARSNETEQMIDQYPLLLREAFILGEDRGISLDRPRGSGGAAPQAFDLHEPAHGAIRTIRPAAPVLERRGASSETSCAGANRRGAGGVRRRDCPPRGGPQQCPCAP
jgi:tetratricopeptide (TPR) repeat protein